MKEDELAFPSPPTHIGLFPLCSKMYLFSEEGKEK